MQICFKFIKSVLVLQNGEVTTDTNISYIMLNWRPVNTKVELVVKLYSRLLPALSSLFNRTVANLNQRNNPGDFFYFQKNSDDINTDLDLRLFSIPRPSIKRSTSGVREIHAFRNVLRHNTKPYAAKPFNDGDVIRNHPNSRRQFSITQATPQSGRITQTNDRNSLPGDFHRRASYNLEHNVASMTSYTENNSISSVSSETSTPLSRRLSKRNMALPNVYCTIDTG